MSTWLPYCEVFARALPGTAWSIPEDSGMVLPGGQAALDVAGIGGEVCVGLLPGESLMSPKDRSIVPPAFSPEELPAVVCRVLSVKPYAPDFNGNLLGCNKWHKLRVVGRARIISIEREKSRAEVVRISESKAYDARPSAALLDLLRKYRGFPRAVERLSERDLADLEQGTLAEWGKRIWHFDMPRPAPMPGELFAKFRLFEEGHADHEFQSILQDWIGREEAEARRREQARALAKQRSTVRFTETTVEVVVESAGITICHPEDLEQDEVEDIFLDDEISARLFKSGKIVAFKTGGDGEFAVRCVAHPSSVDAHVASTSFLLHVTHGRVFISDPYLIDFANEAMWIDVPIGTYRCLVATLNAVADDIPDFEVVFERVEDGSSIDAPSEIPLLNPFRFGGGE